MAKVKHLWEFTADGATGETFLITTDSRSPLLAVKKVVAVLRAKRNDYSDRLTLDTLKYGGTIDA